MEFGIWQTLRGAYKAPGHPPRCLLGWKGVCMSPRGGGAKTFRLKLCGLIFDMSLHCDTEEGSGRKECEDRAHAAKARHMHACRLPTCCARLRTCCSCRLRPWISAITVPSLCCHLSPAQNLCRKDRLGTPHIEYELQQTQRIRPSSAISRTRAISSPRVCRVRLARSSPRGLGRGGPRGGRRASASRPAWAQVYNMTLPGGHPLTQETLRLSRKYQC